MARNADDIKASRKQTSCIEKSDEKRPLRNSHTARMFENLIRNYRHPIYVINIETYELEMTNDAALLDSLDENITCFSFWRGRNEPCICQECPCPLQEIKQTRKSLIMNQIHCTDDSVLRHSKVFVQPIFDEKRNITHVIECLIDSSESSVQAKTEWYKQIFENSNDAIVICNTHGNIMDVNSKAEQLFGFSKNKLKSLLFAELHPPEALEQSSDAFDEVLKNGSITLQMNFRTKAGEVFPAEMSSNLLQIDDKYLIQSTIRDISDFVGIKESLLLSQDNLHTLFDSIDHIMFILDLEGQIIEANTKACRSLGYTCDQLRGLDFTMLYPPKQNDEIKTIMTEILTGITSVCTKPLITKRGSMIPVETRVSLGKWNLGDVIYCICLDTKDQQQRDQITSLHRDLAIDLGSTNIISNALSRIVYGLLQVEGIDSAGVYLVEEKTRILNLKAKSGVPIAFKEKITSFDEVIQKYPAILSGDSYYGNSSELAYFIQDYTRKHTIQSLGIIPVQHESKTIAALIISSYTHQSIPKYSREIVEAIASHAGSVITRISAETAFREQKDKAQMYLDLAEVMFVALDADGNITMLNPKACKVLGCSNSDIIGVNWFDTFIPENMRSEVFRIFQKLMANEIDSPEFYENTAITLDGKEKTIAWHNTVLTDEDGNPIGTFSSGEDISAKKAAEYALRVSEAKFRAVFETSGIGMTLVDTADHILDANRSYQKMLGYTLEELREMTIADFTHPGDVVIDALLFQEMMKGLRDSYRMEKRYIRKDGQMIWVDLTVSCVRDENGEISFLCGMVADITKRKQAKIALEESKKQFQTVFTQAPFAAALLDLDGHVLMSNIALQKMIGYTEKELENLRFTKFTHPDDIDADWSLCQELINGTRDTYRLEKRYLHKNGSIIWGSLAVSLIRDLDGKPKYVVGMVEDITDRKLADMELKNSEEKYHTLFDSIGDAVFIHDIEGNFLAVNSTACERLAYSEEELLQMNPKDIDSPENVVLVYERIDEIQQKGHLTFETEHYSRLGEKIPVEINSRLITYSGKPAILSIARDISVRKQVEDQIQQQRDFLERVIESLPHPFYVIDVNDFTIKIANKASGFGQLSGVETCYSLTHNNETPCNGKQHPCPLNEVLHTKKPVVTEHIHYNKDSNLRFLEIHAYPVFDEDGNIVQMIEYDLDVTEQKWAEKQLETESKRARLYLDLLAHDIANQLQAIWGNAELIRELLGESHDEILHKFIEQIVESARSCKNLISKAKSTEQLQMAPLVERSLSRAFHECIEAVTEDYNSILIDIEIETEDATIMADKYLEKLLENILENAMMHNPAENKSVWVKLRCEDEGYKISIADNGPGIDDTLKEVLFSPSHRVGGLGIHFTADIIEKYGGTIIVKDRIDGEPDQGVEFLIWLPMKRSWGK